MRRRLSIAPDYGCLDGTLLDRFEAPEQKIESYDWTGQVSNLHLRVPDFRSNNIRRVALHHRPVKHCHVRAGILPPREPIESPVEILCTVPLTGWGTIQLLTSSQEVRPHDTRFCSA